MATIANTQIGADGLRHPIGEAPTDTEEFRRRNRSVADGKKLQVSKESVVEPDEGRSPAPWEAFAVPRDSQLQSAASGARIAGEDAPSDEGDGGEVSFEDMTKDELLAYADENGLPVKRSARVDDLRAEVEFLSAPLEDLTKAELVEVADAYGFEVDASAKAADLRAEVAAGIEAAK